MASQYWIAAADGTGVVHLSGTVAVSEILQAGYHLYEAPAWEKGFAECWDLRGVTQLLLSPADIRAVVETEMASLEEIGMGPVAIIVTRPLDYMIAYLYQRSVRSTGRPVRVFREAAEACTWLGVSGDVLRPPVPPGPKG